MALRGENVGTAYVRILADGSGLDRSIRDEFKQHEGAFNDSGEKNAEAWREGWKKELSRAPSQKEVREALAKPLTRGKWLEEDFFKGQNWREFQNGLEQRFGDAGKRAADNLRRKVHLGMDLGALKPKMEAILPDIVTAERQLQSERLQVISDAQTEAIRMNREYDAEIMRQEQKLREDRDREFAKHIKDLERMASEAADAEMKARLDADRQLELHWRDLAKQAEINHAHEQALAESTKRMWDEANRDNAAWDRQRRRQITAAKADYTDLNEVIRRLLSGDKDFSRMDTLGRISRLRDEMKRLSLITPSVADHFNDSEKAIRRMSPFFDDLIHKTDNYANLMKKAFGGGSENMFLRFIGNIAGAFGSIPSVILKAGRAVERWGKDVGQAFAEGKGFSKLLGDVGKLAGGAVAGLAGMFYVLGPLVSVFSELAGGVVALAGSISFGLVGALGALAGGAFAAAAAIGTLVLGFAGLKGKNQAAFQDMLGEIYKLRTAAAKGLAFDRSGTDQFHDHTVHSIRDIIQQMQGMIRDFEPLMTEVGRGVADGLDKIVYHITGKNGAWGKFIDAMNGRDNGKNGPGWLGVEARKSIVILGNAFEGILGTLRGLMPLTNRFLNYLRDASERWRDFVNSNSGQRQMIDFFDRAGNSAAQLGAFLKAAGRFLWDLLDAGASTGDGLFGSMTKEINSWSDQLETTAGKKALQQWFRDAAHFARDLGSILKDVVKFLGNLDTEVSRSELNFFMDTLANTLGAVNAVVGPLAKVMGNLNTVTGGLTGTVGAAMLVWPKFSNMLGGASLKLGGSGGLIANIKNTETRMQALKTAARGAAGIGGVALLAESAKHANTGMGDLLQTAGLAATGFAVGGPVGAAVGGLAGLFFAVKRRQDEAKAASDRLYQSLSREGIIKSVEGDFKDLASTLDQVTGAMTGSTRAMVLQKLQSQGLISEGAKYGLTARDMVNAAMGMGRGMNSVNSLLADHQQQIANLDAQYAQLWNDPKNIDGFTGTLQGDAAKQADAILKAKAALEKQDVELRRMPGALRASGKAIQEHTRTVEDLTKSLHGLPKTTRMAIESRGILPTAKDLADLQKQYHLTPKRIRTIIETQGWDISLKHVEDLFKHQKELDNADPTVHLSADPSKAEKGIKGVESLTKNLFGIKAPAVLRILGDGSKANDVISNVGSHARSVVNGVYRAIIGADAGDAFNTIADVQYALNQIHDKTVYVHVQKGPGGQGAGYSPTATGGIFNYASRRLIGEAGPEAVVPLNRPLGAVDPAVRWLSAIAQGKADAPMARGGVVGGGRTVDVGGITVVSPNADPKAVAVQTINQLIAAVI